MEEQKGSKKHFPILPVILGSVVFLVSACYGAGALYYQNHFLPGTVIDRIDVSGMTIEDLETQVQEYFLKVAERQPDGTVLEEDIQGKDIGLSYTSGEPLEELLQSQNVWTWFIPQTAEHMTEELIAYDEEKLKEEIDGLKGFQNDFYEAPTDAYISGYTPESGFEIVPETQGNQLNRQKTLDAVQGAVAALEEEVDLDAEGCYEVPEVTAENEQLAQTLEKLQQYAGIEIAYTFGSDREILDGETVSGWLQVEDFDVSLDREQVKAYVDELRKKYDTIFHSRTFHTSYGKDVTIDRGDYGWWMNTDQETEELSAMLEAGESGERTPVYYQTAANYGTPDYGTSYVEINLSAQHLFLYKNGNLVLESDFVSGNSARGYDTPAGIYGITYKQRNATLVGENYRTPVSYWMPFNGNIGMHDATWRASFGGTIYKTNGSHGCINLPFSAAQQIYGEIEKGSPVICYYLPGTEPAEPAPEQSVPGDPAAEQPVPADPAAEQPVPADPAAVPEG